VTAATFGAKTADGDGPYMRTGDLGFLKDGQLFVSVRLKDLIIIRGRNYYPDDLETAVYQSNVSLRPGGAAAFTLSADGGETELIVVAELQKWYLPLLDTNSHPTLVADARARVADLFGLRVAQVVLINPGGMPKTSSGKLRRRHCRDLFLAGKLDVATIEEPLPIPESGARVAR
jgi:acyl-CoA synthetase (AMP-forming)/AMP-acid ligase II